MRSTSLRRSGHLQTLQYDRWIDGYARAEASGGIEPPLTAAVAEVDGWIADIEESRQSPPTKGEFAPPPGSSFQGSSQLRG